MSPQPDSSRPVVDVGMPAHRRPVYIAQAVQSVLAQGWDDLRLVILDNSRGDEIQRAVAPFLADPRVEHRATEPMSATQAMTALMGAGTGRYFAFLHDDDRWGPDFLARRVRFLEEHEECGFVFSGHIDIDAQGRETARFAAPFPEGVVPRSDLIPEMLRRSVVDTMHSVLSRRSALEAVGCGLDHDFPRLFDWELWLRLAMRFPVGCIDAEDAEYRAHEEQMSALPGRAEDFAQMFEYADRLAAEHAPELRLPPRERRRRRAGLEVSRALDRLQADDATGARRALLAAARTSPPVMLDRRFPVALLGLAGGSRGRRAVSGWRTGAYQRTAERRRGRR